MFRTVAISVAIMGGSGALAQPTTDVPRQASAISQQADTEIIPYAISGPVQVRVRAPRARILLPMRFDEPAARQGLAYQDIGENLSGE